MLDDEMYTLNNKVIYVIELNADKPNHLRVVSNK